MFGGNLIWRINNFLVIGGFYIGKHYCILHALGIKKRIQRYLIWQIFVIRQTTKINSTPNFHLIWYTVQ